MRKLTLDLDSLRVDTFETASADRAARGTIRGLEMPAEFVDGTAPESDVCPPYTQVPGCTALTFCACTQDCATDSPK